MGQAASLLPGKLQVAVMAAGPSLAARRVNGATCDRWGAPCQCPWNRWSVPQLISADLRLWEARNGAHENWGRKRSKNSVKTGGQMFRVFCRSPMFSFSRGVSETMKQRSSSEVAYGSRTPDGGERPGVRPGSCEPVRAQSEESRSGD